MWLKNTWSCSKDPVPATLDAQLTKMLEKVLKFQPLHDYQVYLKMNTAELKPSKLPKRQNSVWVGNLSFKTTPEALRAFFAGCGEITRVHMPMKMASTGPGGRGAVKQNRGSVCSLRLRAGLDVIFVFPDLRMSTLRRPMRRRLPLRCRKIR